MEKLDSLILIRIIGEENGNEFLFKALLIKDKFDPNSFYNPLKKEFCKRDDQTITINELGPLKDYLNYNDDGPFGVDGKQKEILSFIKSKQVVDLIDSGGGLFIEDVNFEEPKYTFQMENNEVTVINNLGEIVRINYSVFS